MESVVRKEIESPKSARMFSTETEFLKVKSRKARNREINVAGRFKTKLPVRI